eukprot:m51a1_g10201 hypothetical protein (421) ;mRNA; f:49688-52318
MALARAQCGTGDTGEMWDEPPYRPVASLAAPSSQKLCGNHPAYSARYFQLFAPREVPWRYTRVCFSLLSNTTATVKGDIGIHPPFIPGSVNVITPAQATSSVAFKITLDPSNPWQTLDLTTGRLTFKNYDYTGWYALYTDASATYNTVKAIPLRAEGHPSDVAPVSWVCPKADYKDGKCDCNCGAWDPDCRANPHSDDCLTASAVCDQTGVCTGLDWNETLCNATHFWANDGCQCECGGTIIDPDCFDLFAAQPECHAKNFTSPICVNEGATTKCKERWTCSQDKYADGRHCDCGCGIQDPDCDLSPRVPTSCHDDWQCINGICLVPPDWTCPWGEYGSGDGCQCLCGTYDPDCDTSTMGYVYSCHLLQICNYDGLCTARGCGNNVSDPFSLEVGAKMLQEPGAEAAASVAFENDYMWQN